MQSIRAKLIIRFFILFPPMYYFLCEFAEESRKARKSALRGHLYTLQFYHCLFFLSTHFGQFCLFERLLYGKFVHFDGACKTMDTFCHFYYIASYRILSGQDVFSGGAVLPLYRKARCRLPHAGIAIPRTSTFTAVPGKTDDILKKGLTNEIFCFTIPLGHDAEE